MMAILWNSGAAAGAQLMLSIRAELMELMLRLLPQ